MGIASDNQPTDGLADYIGNGLCTPVINDQDIVGGRCRSVGCPVGSRGPVSSAGQVPGIRSLRPGSYQSCNKKCGYNQLFHSE